MNEKFNRWKIKERLTHRRISQDLNVTPTTVSNWFTGKQAMSVENARNFEEKYGVDPVEEFGVKLAVHWTAKKEESKPVSDEVFKKSSQKIMKKNKELYQSLEEGDNKDE